MALSLETLSPETLWAVPASIFVAGFIGSPHCVAMCGPLVLGFASSRAQMISYQAGRFVTYTIAGAVAGLVGSTLLDSLRNSTTGIIALAAMFIGLILIGFMQISGEKLHLKIPSFISTPINRAFSSVRRSALPKELISFSAGALSVGLPCAHLWSFLLGAAAMGSSIGGAVFMSAFWLGTLPALVAAPWSLLTLKRLLGKRASLVAGAIMISAGLLSLAHFTIQLGAPTSSHDHHGQAPASSEHSHHAHH